MIADHELRTAEAAAERQRPYRSPDRWSLNTPMFSRFYDRFVGRQRAAHDGWQDTLRRWKEGDEDAKEAIKFHVNIANMCHVKADLNPKEFKPHSPSDQRVGTARLRGSRPLPATEQHCIDRRGLR